MSKMSMICVAERFSMLTSQSQPVMSYNTVTLCASSVDHKLQLDLCICVELMTYLPRSLCVGSCLTCTSSEM